MQTLYLASSSARRKEILTHVEIPFVECHCDFDETYDASLSVYAVAEFLAKKKLHCAKEKLHDASPHIILAADTVIIFQEKIYGKPKNYAEAKQFLQAFSGNSHLVTTGLAVYNSQKNEITTCTSTNEVQFAKLSEAEIDFYLATNEWQGVAGGYQIQGKAAFFISCITGNFTAIMGLPLFELYAILKTHGFTFFSKAL